MSSRPVKLTDFADHVAKMKADSDFKFSEEYEVKCVLFVLMLSCFKYLLFL